MNDFSNIPSETEIRMKIKLPDDGHVWREVNVDATHTDFVCECGAHFSHDMIDDTCTYDEGEGHGDDY